MLAVAGYVATVRPGVVGDEAAGTTDGTASVAAQPEAIAVAIESPTNEPPINEPPINEPVTNEPVTTEPDLPVPVAAASGATPPTERSWWERIDTSSAGRAVAAAGALVVLLIGVAPMAAAAVDRSADPAIAESSTGPPSVVASPAPAFSLVDQTGHDVSLASLEGHVVVLSFLDPVCTTDCPVIAQELRVADELLGPDAGDVRFVAIMASRLYTSREAMVAFDQQEGLDSLPNWSFLTGPVDRLATVWKDYGMQVLTAPAGGMSLHSDTVFVIDAHGTLRRVLNADIGAGGHASQVSFAEILAQQVTQVLHP
jgi:cytochrome oxidase Cu insertion factor (SCO1/SenC/PrrC family)